MGKTFTEKSKKLPVSALELSESLDSFKVILKGLRQLEALERHLAIFRTVSASDAAKPIQFDYHVDREALSCSFEGELNEAINFLLAINCISENTQQQFMAYKPDTAVVERPSLMVTLFESLSSFAFQRPGYKQVPENESANLSDRGRYKL